MKRLTSMLTRWRNIAPPFDAAQGRPSSRDPAVLADEVEAHLRDHVLGRWFPRCVDRRRGGFLQEFKRDWSPGPDEPKTLVFQSRMTWVAAEVARRRADLAETYTDYARHGLALLRDHLWDREHGGFRWREHDTGDSCCAAKRPAFAAASAEQACFAEQDKHAYGIAFGIYAAAAVYRATSDPDALDLARRAFTWLDTHAYDDAHGGYFEPLRRDGTPIPTRAAQRSAASQSRIGTRTGDDAIGTPLGHKSSNAHLHMLEAFTELYRARPEPALRDRIEELVCLIRDVMFDPAGFIHVYFTPDFRPAGDAVSFGHDVEAAYLLADAADALGRPDDAPTWTTARQLVDHALQHGCDTTHGGFFLEGKPARPAYQRHKVWWVQAEALNALAMMHERFGNQSPIYFDRFLDTWSFIRTRQLDRRHGGWYDTLSPTGRRRRDPRKAHEWKAAYHNARALLNAADRLGRLP